MTTAEAAAALGVNLSRVRQLANDIDVYPFTKWKLNGCHLGRDWRFSADEVRRFAALKRPAGRPVMRGWERYRESDALTATPEREGAK